MMNNEKEVSSEDIRRIMKLESHFGIVCTLTVGIIAFTVCCVTALFNCPENLPILLIITLLLTLALRMYLKERVISACYGTITDVEIRHGKCSAGRTSMPFSYSDTFEGPAPKRRFMGDSYFTVKYCTVEANGRVIEHIQCTDKYNQDMNIGDHVIVGIYGSSGRVKLYPAAENKDSTVQVK